MTNQPADDAAPYEAGDAPSVSMSTMYERVYWKAQDALDELLGPSDEDGSGGGLVADIFLLGRQRDEARAEIARLRAGLERITTAARALWEASEYEPIADVTDAHKALGEALASMPAPTRTAEQLCGDEEPDILSPSKRRQRCTRPAGHDGWHRSESGTEWASTAAGELAAAIEATLGVKLMPWQLHMLASFVPTFEYGWLGSDGKTVHPCSTRAHAERAASRSGARQLMRRTVGPWRPVTQ